MKKFIAATFLSAFAVSGLPTGLALAGEHEHKMCKVVRKCEKVDHHRHCKRIKICKEHKEHHSEH